ncbi:MAG TPA: hypothetical protein VIK86_00120 [Candidatus Paceibacterota bacterium]
MNTICFATGPSGVIAASITIGYIGILANRIDNANIGRGVCVHMTKSMVYTVVSQ